MFKIEKQEGHFFSNLKFIFSGRLDTDACSQDSKDIEDKIQSATVPVVFDLAEVNYISSAFLRICIKTAKTLGKEKFSIINVSPQIMKVFKIAGLDSHLTIK